MNHQPPIHEISDDDLVLVFYGEHEDAQLAATIANTPALAQRFAELSEHLSSLETLTVPSRDAGYGAAVWQQIQADLTPPDKPVRGPFWSNLFSPQFSVAGVTVLVGATLLAFWLGQRTQEPASPSIAGNDVLQLDTQRLLTSRVAEHLSATDRLLTQLVNADGAVSAQPSEAEWATDLLLSNRIYRHAANNAGHARLATLLDEIEPLLLELAHQSNNANSANSPNNTPTKFPGDQVDRNLLFKVRVMNQKLDEQSKQI